MATSETEPLHPATDDKTYLPLFRQSITSLASLSPDILVMITDILLETSPKSLSSFALLNSYLHGVARYSQLHSVKLALRDRSDWWQSVRDKGPVSAVRSLTIVNFAENSSSHYHAPSQDEPFEDRISQLCSLLPKMTGLGNVYWSSGVVPAKVLQVLQVSLPSARLHVQLSERRYEHMHKPFLDHLQASTALSSMDVFWTYVDAEICLALTQPLKRLLLSCPNLKRLRLVLDIPSSCCVVHEMPREYHGFGFVNGEHPLSALEELELINYPFGVPLRNGWSNMSIGYPHEVYEEEYWSTEFDWSALRALRTPNGIFAAGLAPKLHALREVDFTGSINQVCMSSFFELVPTEALAAITIPNKHCIGLESLYRLGPRLKKLCYHQVDCTSWTSDCLDVEGLTYIQETCPNLVDLGLGISRIEEDWPYAALDVLATFPCLQRLSLWFEIGDLEVAKPALTFSASCHLAEYVFSRAASSTKLEAIHLYSGGPSNNTRYESPAEGCDWDERTGFVCEQVGEAAEGGISVHCPTLTDEENARLQSWELAGQETDVEEGGGRRLFRVAWKGPVCTGPQSILFD